MPPMYEVADWVEHFEVSQSTRVKGALKWVAMPTKHDGLTFRRVIGRKDAGDIYTAWALILQVAAKCPTRGLLCGGACSEHAPSPLRACSECQKRALVASDFSLKTGFKESAFQAALEVLSSQDVGWLLRVDSEHAPSTNGARSEHAPSAVNLARAGEHDETRHDMTGQDKTGRAERMRKDGKGLSDSDWLSWLQEQDAYRGIDVKRCHDRMLMWCAQNNKEATRRRFINWLNREDKPMLATRSNGNHAQTQLNLSPKMQRNFEVLSNWSPPVKNDETK